MSRRVPVKRSVAIAVARPMPVTAVLVPVVAVAAVSAFFVSPLLGLGIVGIALWHSLGE